PIVPTFTWGFVRSNFAFAMEVLDKSFSADASDSPIQPLFLVYGLWFARLDSIASRKPNTKIQKPFLQARDRD
ncbi:MAG: hypothetical protein M3403_07505, partial [Gemmatimonadota bacterium]|nr:hypothetical protein [Gemmatimonadota bacterium]